MSTEITTSAGLRLEVAGRELTGSLGGGDHRKKGRWEGYLLGVPAAALLALLVIPMLWTLKRAVWELPVLGNFGEILTDRAALRSAWHSVLWVGIALVVLAAGYGIAVLSKRVGGGWRIAVYALILPFGVSALVAGATFRLIFDPNPERGIATALLGVTFLGPNLIWWVLASAFAWSWLGFVVVLFRAGLDATPGVRRFARLTLPRPGPVSAIVVLTVLVAAIRVFDLVLIATPRSIQDDVDVVGLHWLRLTVGSPDTGAPAALAVLLFAVVAALSLFGMRTSRRTEPRFVTTQAVAPPVKVVRKRVAVTAWWTKAGGVGLVLLWVAPLVVLVATALHIPEVAGALGFWTLDGLGLGSFAEVSDTWLWPAVAGSLLIAGLATGLVLAAAVPAAYWLTWVLPDRPARVLVVVLAVLAVAPVQMYAGPLNEVFAELGLAGSRAPLALVHAAAGVPFATLVLRTAFRAAPKDQFGRPALDAVWRRGSYRPTLVAVAVLEFVLVWNDFIVAYLISGPGTSPLTLLLWGEARQFGTSAGTIAASAVVSALIPAALLLATWRTVVAGLTGKATP